MNTLVTLIILFFIGTSIYRFFSTMIGNNSTSSQNGQRSDSRNRDSVSLKDAFVANNATRQKYASKSPTASSQKRNQQVQSKQLSRRMQQEGAKRRAENLQQNNKRRTKPVQSSAVSGTPLLHETSTRKNTSQQISDRGDLTSLTPIDKVTSIRKATHQSVAKNTHFQNDYLKGIIYKEILDKPVSLRRTK